jgi:chloramphenicol O-acetyltransferase type A
MKKVINIQSWKRRDHFLFFRRFDDPFYDITVHVDMTRFSERVKEEKAPFFISYLYASLKAIHHEPAFRLRLEEDSVVEFDTVSAGPAIERPDGTFGFSRIPYHEDFGVFCRQAEKEIKRVRDNSDLYADSEDLDVIYYSTIPWFSFTGLSQPRMNLKTDSVPKIVFGRIEKENDRLIMPMALQVHHALIDGRDIADYLKHFQNFLNE